MLRLEQAGWVSLSEPSYRWVGTILSSYLPSSRWLSRQLSTPAHRRLQRDLVIELLQAYRLPAVTPGTLFVTPPQDQQGSDGLPIGGLAELPTLLGATCCLPA